MLIHTAKLAHYNLRYRTKASCLTAAYKANPKDRLPKVASTNANDVIRSVWCILEVTLFGQPRSMVAIYQFSKENREVSSAWLIRQILIIKNEDLRVNHLRKWHHKKKKETFARLGDPTWMCSYIMHSKVWTHLVKLSSSCSSPSGKYGPWLSQVGSIN